MTCQTRIIESTAIPRLRFSAARWSGASKLSWHASGGKNRREQPEPEQRNGESGCRHPTARER